MEPNPLGGALDGSKPATLLQPRPDPAASAAAGLKNVGIDDRPKGTEPEPLSS